MSKVRKKKEPSDATATSMAIAVLLFCVAAGALGASIVLHMLRDDELDRQRSDNRRKDRYIEILEDRLWVSEITIKGMKR